MSFREECIEAYRKNEEQRDRDNKIRAKEDVIRIKKTFAEELSRCFGIDVDINNIKYDDTTHWALYKINDIELVLSTYHSYRDICIIVHCSKCNNRYIYNSNFRSKIAIGKYLCEDTSKNICQTCKFEEQDKNRTELAKKRKETQEKTEKKVSYKLAKSLAEFLSFHGFRIESPPDFYDEEYCDDGDPF